MEGTLADNLNGISLAEETKPRLPTTLQTAADADIAWQWAHRVWSARQQEKSQKPAFDIDQTRHSLCQSLVELRVEPKWHDSHAFTRVKEKLQEHHIPSEVYETQIVALHGLYFQYDQKPSFYAQHNLDGAGEAQKKIQKKIEETEWSLIDSLVTPANHNEQDGSGI